MVQRFHFPNPVLTALAFLGLPVAAAASPLAYVPSAALLARNAILKRTPVLALAAVDPKGRYRVPDGFVILKQRFNGGYIVLSFIIAVVGSLCTLELLIRRYVDR